MCLLKSPLSVLTVNAKAPTHEKNNILGTSTPFYLLCTRRAVLSDIFCNECDNELDPPTN